MIFRRTTKQVKAPGGLWDKGAELYMPRGAKPNQTDLTYEFGSTLKIQFAHLEHEKNVYDWQGSEIPLIGFDELTHFTESQFFYMLGRNRSTTGIPGYMRATCNPDADSWVAKFISWWIDPDTGFAIPERSGKMRYFVRIEDTLIWADSKEELLAKYPTIPPKSFTFIPSKLEDNRILMKKDPAYRANLLALPLVERERLLNGNWKIRAVAGNYFKREWFRIVDQLPARSIRSVRYWDRAGTEPSPNNANPDWTAGDKMEQLEDGRFCLTDVIRDRLSPGKVQSLIKNTASQDGPKTTIALEQDPGQAGKADIENLSKSLVGYEVRAVPARQDKGTRARGASAGTEQGIILLLRGPWNDTFIEECVSFSGGDQKAKDDQVDAYSGAYNFLTIGMTGTFTPDMSQQETVPIGNDSEW